MRDPAVEAAERVYREVRDSPEHGLGRWELIVAAREALAPLRREYRDLAEYADSIIGEGMAEGVEAAGIWEALSRIAPLIFREDELETGNE